MYSIASDSTEAVSVWHQNHQTFNISSTFFIHYIYLYIYMYIYLSERWYQLLQGSDSVPHLLFPHLQFLNYTPFLFLILQFILIINENTLNAGNVEGLSFRPRFPPPDCCWFPSFPLFFPTLIESPISDLFCFP